MALSKLAYYSDEEDLQMGFRSMVLPTNRVVIFNLDAPRKRRSSPGKPYTDRDGRRHNERLTFTQAVLKEYREQVDRTT